MMKSINRLYIVRHGQVVGYEKMAVYGSSDVEITEVGRSQMEHLAERLRFTEINAIYSSDLKRASVGAQIIGRWHEVPLYPLADLREMDFGEWEGLAFGDITKQFGEELEKRQKDLCQYRAPGARENIHEMAERVLSCLKQIREKHQGQNILIVAHGQVNRVILCDALGLSLDRIFHLHQDYGCLNIIDYYPDSTLVRLVNG